VRKEQIVHALGIGLVLAAAAVGLTLGGEIHRFAVTTWAVEDLQQCLEMPDPAASEACVTVAHARLHEISKGVR